PGASRRDSETPQGAAGDRGHRLARHAHRRARHGRQQDRALHDLCRQQGRLGTEGLRRRMSGRAESGGRRAMNPLAGVLCALVLAAAAPARAEEAPQNLVLYDAPKPVPDLGFEDGSGKALRLADFRGRVVVLNLWATWCLPCRKEMPTLDRLQAQLGGSAFEVVAISIDRGGMKVVDP